MGDGSERTRIFEMELAYDGSPFCGWSRQPGLPTVEGALRSAFVEMLGWAPLFRVGGRTDTGVHARRQTVSTELPENIETERFAFGLNSLTPKEISVTSLAPASPSFDARADAVARLYRYYLWPERPPSPFCRSWTWQVDPDVDVDIMARAARLFEGRHDFTAFTPTDTRHVYLMRTVNRCRLHRRGKAVWLSVEANAFLRHMVRIMVGTLVDIGKGKKDLADLEDLLAGGTRTQAGPTAPPHGLFLWGIRYRVPEAAAGSTPPP